MWVLVTQALAATVCPSAGVCDFVTVVEAVEDGQTAIEITEASGYLGFTLDGLDQPNPVTVSATVAGVTLVGSTRSSTIELLNGAQLTVIGVSLDAGLVRAANCTGGGTLTFDDVEIDGSEVWSGIRSDGCHVELVGGSVRNTFGTRGAGLSLEGGASAIVTSTRFEGNASELDGGAILVEESSLVVTGATFVGNVSFDPTTGGGAVSVGSGGTLVTVDGTFEGNTALGRGGSVRLVSGTWVASGDTFLQNGAAIGGAVYADDSIVELVGSTFTGNVATADGGALAFAGSSVDVTGGASFSANVATGLGGDAWLFGGDVEISGELADGQAKYGGSLALGGGGSYTVADATIRGATAFLRGGAVHVEGGAVLTLRDSLVDGTWAADTGGVVDAVGAGPILLERAQLCQVGAGLEGGAVHATQSDPITLSGVVVDDASAPVGGLTWSSETDIDLVHVSIGALDGSPSLAFSELGSLSLDRVLLAERIPTPQLSGSAARSYADVLVVEGGLAVDSGPVVDAEVTDDAPVLLLVEDPLPCATLRLHPGSPVGISAMGDVGAYGAPRPKGHPWDANDDLDLSSWRYDCDDNDATVAGHAEEQCNLADDDCDDLVDEGLDVVYPDADGDGFGDLGSEGSACGPSTVGWVEDATDCDDDDDQTYPGAPETCDGADRDCDGVAPALETSWPDADGDGFGDPTRPFEACDPPPGEPTDCDDADPAVNPDARDVPNDGIDQDCSGGDDRTWLSLGGGACATGSPSVGPLAFGLALALRRRAASRGIG